MKHGLCDDADRASGRRLKHVSCAQFHRQQQLPFVVTEGAVLGRSTPTWRGKPKAGPARLRLVDRSEQHEQVVRGRVGHEYEVVWRVAVVAGDAQRHHPLQEGLRAANQRLALGSCGSAFATEAIETRRHHATDQGGFAPTSLVRW